MNIFYLELYNYKRYTKMKKIIIYLIPILFSISSKGQVIINSGFENWFDLYNCPYENELIDIYNIPNPITGSVNSWYYGSNAGITRTTDSYEGEYSLIIHNWYSYMKE